jgi:hypothetical protein
MGVPFLLVPFAEAKDDSNGKFELLCCPLTTSVNGVFKDVRCDSLAIHCVCNAVFLVATHLCSTSEANKVVRTFRTCLAEELEGLFIDPLPTTRNNANDNFLPTILTPCFGPSKTAEVCNVLHNFESDISINF